MNISQSASSITVSTDRIYCIQKERNMFISGSLLLLTVLHQSFDASAFLATVPSCHPQKLLSQHQYPASTTLLSFDNDNDEGNTNTRRNALKTITFVPLAWIVQTATTNQPALAVKGIKPEAAFQSFREAQGELVTAAKTYLPTRDYEGMLEYLNEKAVNMNAFEANASALLASKKLDAESKKEIGTIRRYGVAADVLIMYGGLKEAVEQEDGGGTQKFLKRTLDSLSEVILICRSNGFE
jgi:hypothetical protein